MNFDGFGPVREACNALSNDGHRGKALPSCIFSVR